ncbi:hypothetical protein [Staphylococcus equorum]|uniref:hypothetical protein n=1 Tax=Staphylococcus equorum TaxID=246432 RepID=UPI00101CB839|nr:hypothetical protein [Staphylococcus equorum]RYD13661.1 hypothetical protein CGA19_01985 [Staphylococcus equorum]
MVGKGYHWNKGKKKWEASIKINGKSFYLGSYIDEIDAIKARKEAETKYAKEIKNTSKKERKVEDLTGAVFGNLKVIGETGKRGSGVLWLVRNVITGEISEAKTAHLKEGSRNGLPRSRHINTISNDPKIVIQRRITNLKKSKGISFDRNKGKWHAYLGIGKRQTKHLGYFENELDAKAARQKAVNEQIKKLENEMERI